MGKAKHTCVVHHRSSPHRLYSASTTFRTGYSDCYMSITCTAGSGEGTAHTHAASQAKGPVGNCFGATGPHVIGPRSGRILGNPNGARHFSGVPRGAMGFPVWLIGCALSIGANIAINLGMTVMKRSHAVNNLLPAAQQKA